MSRDTIERGLTALDILNRCRNGWGDISSLRSAIDMREDALHRCTQQISGMPRGGSGIEDKMAEIICEIHDLNQMLDRRRREYAAEQCASIWILECLPLNEREVMRLWYLELVSVNDIAAIRSCSVSGVKRLKQAGEQKCAKMCMEALNGFLPEWYEKGEMGRK